MGLPRGAAPIGVIRRRTCRACRACRAKRRIVIKGKVQEAGFRKWFTRFAEGTGVEADAKSLADGTIRGRLTGQRWRVEFVTLACHRGPATAKIEQVDVLNVKRI